MSNYKKISITIFLLSLISFNNLNARTVCNYKVTTITENNVIKGHREVKNCEETKITGEQFSFVESVLSSPQYETTLIMILTLVLETI
jgi:hypothetical protein|tara:strand:+ start:491 stop:754 length:264 start_codon:yes stop_codon:yes gene_type:complete